MILPFDRFDDGQVQYKDTDTGVGLNLGLRYQLDERTTLGLAYTSKVDLEFEDSPEFKDIDNPLLSGALNQLSLQSLQVDMAIPQTLSMSVAHSLDEQWTLLASANWQDWSEFGEMGVEVETAAAVPEHQPEQPQCKCGVSHSNKQQSRSGKKEVSKNHLDAGIRTADHADIWHEEVVMQISGMKR